MSACMTYDLYEVIYLQPVTRAHGRAGTELRSDISYAIHGVGGVGSAAPLGHKTARTHSADVEPGRVFAAETTRRKGPRSARVLEAIRGQGAQSIPQCVQNACLQSAADLSEPEDYRGQFGENGQPGMTIHVWPFVGQCSGVGASHETIGVFGCDFSASAHSRECVAESLQIACIASGLLRRCSQVLPPRLLLPRCLDGWQWCLPSSVAGRLANPCRRSTGRKDVGLATSLAAHQRARQSPPSALGPVPHEFQGRALLGFHTRSAWL
jgi:hypothetical protein